MFKEEAMDEESLQLLCLAWGSQLVVFKSYYGSVLSSTGRAQGTICGPRDWSLASSIPTLSRIKCLPSEEEHLSITGHSDWNSLCLNYSSSIVSLKFPSKVFWKEKQKCGEELRKRSIFKGKNRSGREIIQRTRAHNLHACVWDLNPQHHMVSQARAWIVSLDFPHQFY